MSTAAEVHRIADDDTGLGLKPSLARALAWFLGAGCVYLFLWGFLAGFALLFLAVADPTYAWAPFSILTILSVSGPPALLSLCVMVVPWLAGYVVIDLAVGRITGRVPTRLRVVAIAGAVSSLLLVLLFPELDSVALQVVIVLASILVTAFSFGWHVAPGGS